MLQKVSKDSSTLVHGRSLTVGIAGFVLGTGVNLLGTSSRYGFGSDQVIQYTIVLADGSVAKVTKDNTTVEDTVCKTKTNCAAAARVYQHNFENNLFIALRSSGSSFGIATEFLYKTYPLPETLSCVLWVYLETEQDFEKLFKAGQDGRYGITIFQAIVYRRPKLTHMVRVL